MFTHQTWKEQQVDCFLPETTSIRHLPERLNYEEWTGHGLRVLAVAARAVDKKSAYDLEDERD